MKKLFVKIAVLVLSVIFGCKEKFELPKFEELTADRTITEKRSEFLQNTIVNTIQSGLSSEINKSAEGKYLNVFWGMGLTYFSSEGTFIAVQKSFGAADSLSKEFQRGLLEIAYQLYPSSFNQEVDRMMEGTTNSKIFAMAVNYLVRNNHLSRPRSYYLAEIYDRFRNWQSDPILLLLEKSIAAEEQQRPSLIDLFAHDFGGNKIVIYSLQRKNRNHTGLAVVKNSKGKFIRTENNRIFSIPQFARSVSNLPWYITNGNTPPGIFSIQGTAVSENQFIGRTPNLQLIMPFEAESSEFFHDNNLKEEWSAELYRRLLPAKWQDYMGIYGSFFAGKAGRTEIIAHGTTINPDFYIGQPYYPNTPSLGCLTALELWDGASGKAILSYQLELMNAYRNAGGTEGYLVVVEMDDKDKPVLLEEIITDIIKAERLSR